MNAIMFSHREWGSSSSQPFTARSLTTSSSPQPSRDLAQLAASSPCFMLGPIDKTQDALESYRQAKSHFVNFYDQMCLSGHMPNALAPGTNVPLRSNIERASALLQANARRGPWTSCRPISRTAQLKMAREPDSDRASKDRPTTAGSDSNSTPGRRTNIIYRGIAASANAARRNSAQASVLGMMTSGCLISGVSNQE